MLPQELPSSIHCCRVNFSQPIISNCDIRRRWKSGKVNWRICFMRVVFSVMDWILWQVSTALFTHRIFITCSTSIHRGFFGAYTRTHFLTTPQALYKKTSLQCVLVKRYSAAAFFHLHVLLIAMFTHSHYHPPSFLIHGVTRI